MKITTSIKTTMKSSAAHPMGQANASPGPRLLFLMFLAAFIALPIVELPAQECVDFEINPVTNQPWTEGQQVTTEYTASHGVSFFNINNTGTTVGNPALVAVGGFQFGGFNTTNCVFDSCGVTTYPAGSVNGCPNANVTQFDVPIYDELLIPPQVGLPTPDHNVGCWFITTVFGTNNGQVVGIRVTYSDDVNCTQLSGVILDTDTRGEWFDGVGTFGPIGELYACGWEMWRITAYGTTGNTMPLAAADVYPFDDPDGNEYWDSTGWWDTTNQWLPVPNPNTNACGTPGDATGGGGMPIVPVTSFLPNGHRRGDGSVRKFEIDIGGTPSGSNRIDHIDIVQLGITTTVGLGFDLFCPCSIGGDCYTHDTIQICNGEEAGFLDYTLDFWVENNTDYDISKLFIPGTVPGNQSTISPTVINYDTPIPAGTLIHVELNIDVPPGGYGPMEIPIGLMSKDLITGDLFECCATSVNFGYEFDDCNGNDIPDACGPDCNDNDIVDECDIISGTSNDCNDNGVPDECEDWPDCNNNGIPDECDISSGTSNDCNNNGIPDECENCNCCNLKEMRFGDVNGDGTIDIGDAVAMLGYLFNQVAINCVAAMDVNGDNQVDISDPIYHLAYLFNQGAPPVGGTDCTPDDDPADPPLECVNSGCP